MAYYADLSPYVYAGSIAGAVNVGWLDREHDFPKGSVRADVLRKLKNWVATPAIRHRGFHGCEFCKSVTRECRSSTVIAVRSKDRVYAAPALIIHYIEAHGYLPPAEFLRALEEEPKQTF